MRKLGKAVPEDLVNIWQSQQSTDPKWCPPKFDGASVPNTSTGAEPKGYRLSIGVSQPGTSRKEFAEPLTARCEELTPPAAIQETRLAIKRLVARRQLQGAKTGSLRNMRGKYSLKTPKSPKSYSKSPGPEPLRLQTRHKYAVGSLERFTLGEGSFDFWDSQLPSSCIVGTRLGLILWARGWGGGGGLGGCANLVRRSRNTRSPIQTINPCSPSYVFSLKFSSYIYYTYFLYTIE